MRCLRLVFGYEILILVCFCLELDPSASKCFERRSCSSIVFASAMRALTSCLLEGSMSCGRSRTSAANVAAKDKDHIVCFLSTLMPFIVVNLH
jgi:hypothetical protein